jgi:hypothetical protein
VPVPASQPARYRGLFVRVLVDSETVFGDLSHRRECVCHRDIHGSAMTSSIRALARRDDGFSPLVVGCSSELHYGLATATADYSSQGESEVGLTEGWKSALQEEQAVTRQRVWQPNPACGRQTRLELPVRAAAATDIQRYIRATNTALRVCHKGGIREMRHWEVL